MENNNMISKLVLGFIVLILGVSLIGTVATNGIAVTTYTGVSSETIDISGARVSGACPMSINNTYPLYVANLPTGWKASDECPVSSFTMKNQTDIAATVTTDYTFFGINGSLYLENTTRFVGDACDQVINDTTVNYNYCGDDFVNIAWGRTIINLIVGFFALALLSISVGIFYGIGKEAGII